MLELGSGGGNNASHLKRHAAMTLVEPAPGMRTVSAALNPDCALPLDHSELEPGAYEVFVARRRTG